MWAGLWGGADESGFVFTTFFALRRSLYRSSSRSTSPSLKVGCGVLRAVDSLPAALPALIDADRGIANVSEGNQAAIDGPILSRDRINRAREGSASARAVVVVRATAAYQRRCAVGQGAV